MSRRTKTLIAAIVIVFFWLPLPLITSGSLVPAGRGRLLSSFTITASPSIHDHDTGWHGFLERGEWRQA